ncbi:MAG: GNAT family N-acetyltransferase, partial [Solirubrobacteraceae bacterium]
AWHRYPDADDVVVPVVAGNRASWRALERAGFRRVATGELTPDNPVDPRDHVVYHRHRPAPGI